jgi:penicillin-binding protein A
MAHQLHRLGLFFLVGLAAIGLTASYWAFVRQDDLLARGDNPRRILLERRVPRGAIYDRYGTVLAETVGEPGALRRNYTYPELAPVLGYVSPLYGSAGIEASQDAVLHGDAGYSEEELIWRRRLLGAPPPGRAVRLTIDLGLQMTADAALSGYTGAVVLLDAVTGELLAVASHPTYNANTLEADWHQLVTDDRALLLNRAVAGLYQPGGALWPAVVAGALQERFGSLDQAFTLAARPVPVNGQEIACRESPSGELVSLADALRAGCPMPMTTIGTRLGDVRLAGLFRDFRFYEAPAIGLPTASSPALEAVSNPQLAAIGQGDLTVSPLHMALATAALARGGLMPAPQLVMATENRDGAWRPAVPARQPTATIVPDYAEQMRELLAGGWRATAISGDEGRRLAWFLGFTPAQDARYAVAVLLEDGDESAAATIGERVLAAAGSLPD